MEIDHDQREVFLETMELQVDPPEIHGMQPSAESVAARLTSPVVTTYLDTEKIAFERWLSLVFYTFVRQQSVDFQIYNVYSLF